ncbi:hypothetical protein [Bacillus phage vB_BceM_Bc431v3]|uniref:Uncharacterized protein n=1 Tax=Bacillus phage vB_BceM_Bc431v3 TaxID=1195072 RepID=M4HP66_9CAUD|nr:hypothetical protein K201_gp044 [Bacillus phage vB_BceM_Bc431v3]AFQ96352.1 hypothetical protein [Bacillus phage vB_BceM_Bc431v3]
MEDRDKLYKALLNDLESERAHAYMDLNYTKDREEERVINDFIDKLESEIEAINKVKRMYD